MRFKYNRGDNKRAEYYIWSQWGFIPISGKDARFMLKRQARQAQAPGFVSRFKNNKPKKMRRK